MNKTMTRVDILETRLYKLEQAFSMLTQSICGIQNMFANDRLPKDSNVSLTTDTNDEETFAILTKFTPKQHAIVQMLMRGSSNTDICDRFGITESTVKAHVRAIMDKVGVRKRSLIIVKIRPTINDISDKQYKAVSSIGKDWDLNWSTKDKKENKHLY